jgi:hypothetical protein
MASRSKPKDIISQKFPLLKQGNYRVTSPATTSYNCIAWAAGDCDRWWWPDGINYWPQEAPVEVTVEAFKKAYQTLGYEECDTFSVENGFEKIVIYALNGKPTHAARQLKNGNWTSKLGQNIDIEHYAPGAIERSEYGSVVAYMRRPIRAKVGE